MIYSFSQLYTIVKLYHNLLIYSYADGYLNCCQFFVTMNNTSIDILVNIYHTHVEFLGCTIFGC